MTLFVVQTSICICVEFFKDVLEDGQKKYLLQGKFFIQFSKFHEIRNSLSFHYSHLNNFDQLFSDYTKLTGRLGARPTDDLPMVTRKVFLNFYYKLLYIPCNLSKIRKNHLKYLTTCIKNYYNLHNIIHFSFNKIYCIISKCEIHLLIVFHI